MKKSLIALLVLILGACSATDDTPVIPGGSTGNTAVDERISDALGQIGSTDGMQLWRSTEEESGDGDFAYNYSSDLYEGTDTLKTLYICTIDGTGSFDDGGKEYTFDNEVNRSIVSEGTYTKVNSDTVTVKDRNNNEMIKDFKGYDQFYTYTMISEKSKKSKKVDSDATGEWETTPKDQLEIQYYLIKKADNKLYQIKVSKGRDDTYRMNAPELSDEFAKIFDKK